MKLREQERARARHGGADAPWAGREAQGRGLAVLRQWCSSLVRVRQESRFLSTYFFIFAVEFCPDGKKRGSNSNARQKAGLSQKKKTRNLFHEGITTTRLARPSCVSTRDEVVFLSSPVVIMFQLATVPKTRLFENLLSVLPEEGFQSPAPASSRSDASMAPA